jgi:CRP-like cAMP-binding protein
MASCRKARRARRLFGKIVAIPLVIGSLYSNRAARETPLVATVPCLHDIGAAVIADVARLLRLREFPAGAIIARRGQLGDCMYFVVSGEVEVQLQPEAVLLGPGAFFGEMSLLPGNPRNATIVTTQPCTLLALDIVDFRELLRRQPDLARIIHEETDRRLAAGWRAQQRAARNSVAGSPRRRGPRD